ncbi:DUF722 domain-containing protein [Lentilactobacillus hilgardii]|uniref:DUF722 domain-containing protein n=1 Tax=Lentilactobacillus hilgardii TaxID=1588 RepID=A0A6P1ECI5_LENHI|nr:DUF722 domain-containing protein [Lentilactobacillus hilgardii]QHB52463.1 DUF722 domain-containing protein [Lentilactobacillus hilgardii]
MIKLKKALFDYIAEIISDYPKTDQYIKEREDELMNQFQDFRDENVGGGRAQYKNNTGVQDMAITLAIDKRLNTLKRHAKAVEECLNETDDDTKIIINELYIKHHPTLNVYGVAERVNLSASQVKRRRSKFFETLSVKLGL